MSDADYIWDFVLYVSGDDRKSKDAYEHLKALCEDRLKGRYNIEVIDLKKHPEVASKENIYATPTLKIRLPPSLKSIIGDLESINKVLVELDLPLKK